MRLFFLNTAIFIYNLCIWSNFTLFSKSTKRKPENSAITIESIPRRRENMNITMTREKATRKPYTTWKN